MTCIHIAHHVAIGRQLPYSDIAISLAVLLDHFVEPLVVLVVIAVAIAHM